MATETHSPSQFKPSRRAKARYHELLKEHLLNLEAAVNGLDLKTIESVTHQLIGNAALFDYPTLSSLAADLNQSTKVGDINKIRSHYEAICDYTDKHLPTI